MKPAAVAAHAVLEAAALESTARLIARELLRVQGVTMAVRNLRNLQRPLNECERLVLAKLEVVATVLGSP